MTTTKPTVATTEPLDDELFAPLGRRPEATTLTVRELINRVREGRIRVPEFQRPLRWTAEDNRRLIDSLWRGYPIGSLLLWKKSSEAATITVAGAQIEAPAYTDAWWVVDGQQRIMALAGALLELPKRDPRWELHFDPEQPAFLVGEPRAARVGRDVPLVAMGDLKRLGRWIREAQPEAELSDIIEDAQQRLLDYSVPVYVVETDDERPLRAGFARLNSTGARMRADEVFQALFGVPKQGRGLDLGQLEQHCAQQGFGAPPRTEILKAVLAMSGKDPARRVETLPEKELDKLVSQSDAEAALTATIEFLERSCGMPHIRLIPYPVVFFILARWFHLRSDTPPETRSLLARWVWRGAVTGAHQRAAVSQMRLQVADIKDDATASIGRLLARVGSKAQVVPWPLQSFHHDNARSRIEILALMEAGPRDPSGPVSIPALLSANRVAREIVAPQRLPTELRQIARTAANRVLLDSAHTNLQSALKTWGPIKDREALWSHRIDAVAFEALANRDFGVFFARRADVLRGDVDRMLALRTGWDDPELRAPEAYLDEEE